MPPYVTFAFNTAIRETTRFSDFRLVHGPDVACMLNSMLLPEECANVNKNAEEINHGAESTRQQAPQRIQHQQAHYTQRYNVRLRLVRYCPVEQGL